jgi:signal transduction histidine kinase/ActR/RegA family two-component response regulator
MHRHRSDRRSQVNRTAGLPEIDASFTLDSTLLQQRRAASAQRLYTFQIPALRLGGFAILCLMLLLHGMHSDSGGSPAPGTPALTGLIVFNLAYGVLAWMAMRAGYQRTGGLDLNLVFFHVDVLAWLVNLHQLEQGQLFFAYLLLVRVVDQVGSGFRRAFYFDHIVTGAYLAYSLWVATDDPARAFWPERIGIAATMYLLGLYLAVTGLVAERLRNRTRQAVRTARALVENLEQKAAALEAQAVELEQARRHAEQANLAKSQFLAVTSHEIRTPMNGILGTAELLMGTPLNRTQQRYVQTAHRSAMALLALIDDVLDLSRIEAGKLTLTPTGVDLRSLVDDAVELLSVSAGDKPVALSSDVARDVPHRVRADPLRVRQLLVNLLHNALKFTERGTVRLLVSTVPADGAGRTLRFSVRDTGIGIAADKLASIFDAFTQVDASSTRRHSGSGLGLAIVKELVDMMGGRVHVESRLGEGSHFWVDLPLEEAEDATAYAESASAALDGAFDDAASVRVLLVEDEPVNQMIVQEMLKMLGCEVELAEDGQEAHAAAASSRYDIVFMDCHMPVMDGYEATRRIRAAEPLHAHLPIVALTADALATDRDRCLEAGMDDFLTKPVSSLQLSTTITRWTGRRTNPATTW